MKKSKILLLTTLSPIISLPFLSASCITGEKADNKMEKDIKINENTDEKNSSETMNDKQKKDKSNIDSKMEEKADKDSSKSEEGKSMENEHTDGKNSSETMNDEQKQDSKPNPESNSGKQDSETDGSSNGSSSPSENTQNDMPTNNFGINDYLNKVREYGKEASLLITLLEGKEEGAEKAKELLKKYPELQKIVKTLSELHKYLESNLEVIKKEIEKAIGDPGNELLDILKQYVKYREEIKTAIKELGGSKK